MNLMEVLQPKHVQLTCKPTTTVRHIDPPAVGFAERSEPYRKKLRAEKLAREEQERTQILAYLRESRFLFTRDASKELGITRCRMQLRLMELRKMGLVRLESDPSWWTAE